MDTRDPRRTPRGHAKETRRRKSALQIDLNDTPPDEIRATATLVECIQQGGGGRSWMLLQPLAPPPLTIDLEAIDDEVVISSPRSFAEARRNKARRNLEILITSKRPKKCVVKPVVTPQVAPPKPLPKEAAFSCPFCMSSLMEPTSTKWDHIFCKHMYYSRISIHRVFRSTKINVY
ncbi:hypothetical protein MKW98_002765 [Papaver atlanticum]|uniref:Uncharacterized protein n=1 Tax=Papaver atlanticum TaxID=357466 RepID=A0AAD4TH13_9MAGN|nr:hypothetical protein MKW98_002765 [Papaver atlanticum]